MSVPGEASPPGAGPPAGPATGRPYGPPPAGRWRRYCRLSLFLAATSWRSAREYRADFLIGVAAFTVRITLSVAALGIVMANVPVLAGWTFGEVLFLLGLWLVPRGIDHLFTDQLWIVASRSIRDGEFYRYLIRPVDPLFAVLSERFLYSDGFGELVVGAVVLAYAIPLLTGVSVLGVTAAILLSALTALVYASLKVMAASLSFWTVSSFTSLSAVYETAELARLPLTIYPAPVRAALVSVLPFGLTAYAPAVLALRGSLWPLLAVPAGTLAAVLCARLVWRAGLDRYEPVGG